jgi:hypothetical protein
MIIENHHAPYAGITRIRFKGLSRVHPSLSAERTPALSGVIIALVRFCIEVNTSRMEKLSKKSRAAVLQSNGRSKLQKADHMDCMAMRNSECRIKTSRSWEIEKGR